MIVLQMEKYFGGVKRYNKRLRFTSFHNCVCENIEDLNRCENNRIITLIYNVTARKRFCMKSMQPSSSRIMYIKTKLIRPKRFLRNKVKTKVSVHTQVTSKHTNILFTSFKLSACVFFYVMITCTQLYIVQLFRVVTCRINTVYKRPFVISNKKWIR